MLVKIVAAIFGLFGAAYLTGPRPAPVPGELFVQNRPEERAAPPAVVSHPQRWRLEERLSGACTRAIESYCTKPGAENCTPFFYNLRPRPARYVDRILQLRPEIMEAAQLAKIDPEHLIASLLTVQAKLGSIPGNEGFRPDAVNPESLVGASPEGGLGTGLNPERAEGLGTGYLPQGSARGTGGHNGDGLGTGYSPPARSAQGLDTGYDTGAGSVGNIARLSDEAAVRIEPFLRELEGRSEVRSSQEVLGLIRNSDAASIRYAAAILRYNQNVFQEEGLPAYDFTIAATLYGFADVRVTAQRVRNANRLPQANSWGVWALCRRDVIDEVLR